MNRVCWISALLLAGAGLAAEDCPAWRGTTGLGFSAEKGLPVRWSPTENVRWKVPLPEAGSSTPIVLGGHIYLTQAVDKGKVRKLLAFDRADGHLLWERAVAYAEPEPT